MPLVARVSDYANLCMISFIDTKKFMGIIHDFRIIYDVEIHGNVEAMAES